MAIHGDQLLFLTRLGYLTVIYVLPLLRPNQERFTKKGFVCKPEIQRLILIKVRW